MDALVAAEHLRRRFAHGRVAVDGVDCADIVVLIEHAADGAEHVAHRLAEIFPAVRRDENEPLPRRPYKLRMGIIGADGRFQRVDDRVAGHVDRAGIAPLGEKIFLCLLRGGEVIAADDRHRLPVEFLGIGSVDIPRAQSGLHMAHRDAQVIGRKRGGKGGRRVALHKDDIRLFRFQHALESFENAGRYVKERLRVLHNGEIVIRRDGERFEDLIEHLAVLPRDADNGFYSAPGAQLLHERAHFHGLRPRAENQQDLFHGVPFRLPPVRSPYWGSSSSYSASSFFSSVCQLKRVCSAP